MKLFPKMYHITINQLLWQDWCTQIENTFDECKKMITVVVYTQDSNTKTRVYLVLELTLVMISNVSTCIWILSASNQLINEKLTIGMSSIDIYTGHSNTTEYIIDYVKSQLCDSLENYLCIIIPLNA